MLTIYNQHADVGVTRVVLPDSTSQVCLVPDELIEQLHVDKALTSSRRQKRPGLILEARRSQSGRSDAATHRPDRRQGRVAAGSFTASVRRKFEIRQDRYAIVPHPRSSLRSFVRGRSHFMIVQCDVTCDSRPFNEMIAQICPSSWLPGSSQVRT